MIQNEKSQGKSRNPIETYMNEFSAVRHEGVNCCKFTGITCATYADISKDAFLKYYSNSLMELRDVVLISNLELKKESPKEIRTIIKKESDHLEFILSSRTKQEGTEESTEWIKHAEGSMFKAIENEAFGHSLKEMKDRCGKDKKTIKINARTGLPGPGEAWDCIANTYSGDGEALIEFETPDQVTELLKTHILHSCMIDCIVDTAIRNIAKKGWNPISYESLKLYGMISCKTYAYIREIGKKENNAKETGYNITLLDEVENRIAEIQNYRIRYGEARDSPVNEVGKNDKSKPSLDKGYTAKQGRPVEDISIENNSALYISGLSWRQMNCRDRIIAFLLGNKNDMLINYMKFFLGAKRGYNIDEHGFAESGDWTEEIFHNDILNQFGYSVKLTKVDKFEDVHARISDFIDKGIPVGFWMDEYHIFYTPFYLKSHTGHIAAINGYNKDNKLYAIIDHNHLQIKNTSQFIDYGQFYCTYETLENIYSDMDNENQFIITLDELQEGNLPEMEDLNNKFISILSHLADSAQAGKDVETIYNNIKKNSVFDVSSVDDLYFQLGGKELLLDTILNWFCYDQEKTSLVKELSYKIIQNSNTFVNKYIASMYRGKGMSIDKVEDNIHIIQKDSVQLFKEILKQYTERLY